MRRARPAWSGAEFESLLGANWLSKLGILALAVATAFFLKYAFESDWIGPEARVVIGLVGAAVLFGLGQSLLSKPTYRSYAQVLMSGGIVILFLSIYAAYNYYHLIGHTLAFSVLAAAALGASALAVANNTQAVALLCLSGAFLTPALLHQGGADPGSLHRLYAYLGVLNLWSLGLVRCRPWHSLTALSFGATWLLFFGVGPGRAPDLLVAEAFAGMFLAFGCYGGVSTLRKADTPSPEMERMGIAIVLVGCLAFAVASARILAGAAFAGLPALAGAGLLLALLLASMGAALPKLSQHDAAVRAAFRYLSAVAVALLVGVSIVVAEPTPPSQAPVAFAFAVLMYLVFLAVAVRLQREEGGAGPAIALVLANVVTHLLATFRVLAAVWLWEIPAAPLWLPVAGGITLAFLWATTEKDVGRSVFRPALTVAAQVLPVSALLAALSAHGSWPATAAIAVFSAEFVFVSAIWVVSRRLTVLPGLRGDIAGAFGNAFVFLALFAAAVGMQERSGFVLLCGCALGMAAYHAFVAGVWLAAARDDRLLRLVYLVLAVTFVTIAVPLQLRGSHITVAWAAESAALIYVGLLAKEARLRWYGTVLLLLAAAKSLLMDLHLGREPLPFLFNVRMLSGITVIAASYVSAWLLARGRQTLSKDEADVPAALMLVGTTLAVVFGSVERWQHIGATWSAAGRLGAQHFALSLFWSVFAASALAIGVLRRSLPLRAFALGLLSLAAAKALFIDALIGPEPFRLLANTRLLAGAAVVVAASVAYWLVRYGSEAVSEWETASAPVLLLSANVLALIFVSLDLWQHFGIVLEAAGRPSGQHFALSLFWSVYAVAALAIAILRRNAPLRVFALGLLVVTMAKVAVADLFLAPDPFRLLVNTRLLAGMTAVVAAAAATWLLRAARDSISEEEARLAGVLALAANVFALVFVSVDLWQYLGVSLPDEVRGSARQLALSIFWSVYALGGLSVGIWQRSRPVRLFAMGLLYLAILKVFVFDLSFLEQPYRIVSFLGLGLILLLVSLLYTRFEERLK